MSTDMKKDRVAVVVLKMAALVSAFTIALHTGAYADPLDVKDGDGFVLPLGQEIRLWGIDAPELSQTCERGGETYGCGTAAKSMLTAFLTSARLSCQPLNRDRFGRLIARCHIGGDDLAGLMVRSGWALDWPRYSEGFYAADQDAARAAGRGLWQGDFTAPWDWRAER